MKKTTFTVPQDHPSLDEEAAHWIMRCEASSDATLLKELDAWLEKSQEHRRAYERQLHTWSLLDSLAQENPGEGQVPNPDLLSPRKTKPQKIARFVLQVALPVAAVITLGLFLFRNKAPENTSAPAPAPIAAEALLPCERRLLEDGSELILKRGTRIDVAFTQEARRVTLITGEVHAHVAKDPGRPFHVIAGGVTARAVGTEFNVRLGKQDVFVLVSEGKVQVSRNDTANPAQSQGTLLSAGDTATIPAGQAKYEGNIRHLPPSELENHQAWEPRMLNFEAACLSDIVQAFNRANEVQLRIDDPSLAAMQLTASLRSDNVAGFLRLLESGFSVHSRQISRDSLLLERSELGNTGVTKTQDR